MNDNIPRYSESRLRGCRLLSFVLVLLLTACTQKQEPEALQMPDLLMHIQQQSRLYSAECHVRKIISHHDTRQLSGKVLNQDFNIDLPLGERRIAIPVEATVKAYIDFSHFSRENIRQSGRKIEIVLPDPEIELTSTRVSHEEVRQHVPLLRADFTDEELTRLEHAGRDAIVAELPKLDITETARRSAAHTLIPMLAEMGFAEEDITVTFRKKFSASDLRKLITQKSED